jgi:hypothetical protein
MTAFERICTLCLEIDVILAVYKHVCHVHKLKAEVEIPSNAIIQGIYMHNLGEYIDSHLKGSLPS